MRYLRVLFVALALIVAAVSQADQYKDAMTAYDKGDFVTAIREFTSLAKSGNAAAQFKLGVIYSKGQGVPTDYQQALNWYRKAADQGDAAAQFKLGVIYAKGRGVPKDVQQAYFWWLLASVSGDAKAVEMRDLVEKTLSPQQRAAAQAQARNWKPRK